MKGFIRFITFLVFVGIILLAFLFAVNNTTNVSLWLGTNLPPTSVGVLVICAFVAGGLSGLLLGLGVFRNLRYQWRIRRLNAELEKSRETQPADNRKPVRRG